MVDYLHGGRNNQIFKRDNMIYRPANVWSPSVQLFLKYLHQKGFDCVPYPYGFDNAGHEIVGFVEGQVYNDLLPKDIRSDETLMSVASTLKTFHDLGAEYIHLLSGDEPWMLNMMYPIEVMCHGDYAPYNIAFKEKRVSGIIDFDTLHPGPRLWDIAYTLYRWIPLMHPDNPEDFGDEASKLRRLTLFCDTYGLEETNHHVLYDWVVKRLEALIEYMTAESSKGDETFTENVDNGHIQTYLSDVQYIMKLKK